jgi:hypothetical protein
MNWRLQSAYDCIEIAKEWEEKSDDINSWLCYQDAVTNFVSISLSENGCSDDIWTWLSDKPFEFAVTRYIFYTNIYLDNLYKNSGRWSNLVGTYLYTAFAHFFAILEDWERSDYFTNLGAKPELWTDPAPMWCQYGPLLKALSNSEQFTPSFGKLNRTEKYMLPYVDLMMAGMERSGIADALVAVDASFAKRNADKRNLDDPYMIDGNGFEPQHIDLRKEGLLSLFRRLGIDPTL